MRAAALANATLSEVRAAATHTAAAEHTCDFELHEDAAPSIEQLGMRKLGAFDVENEKIRRFARSQRPARIYVDGHHRQFQSFDCELPCEVTGDLQTADMVVVTPMNGADIPAGYTTKKHVISNNGRSRLLPACSTTNAAHGIVAAWHEQRRCCPCLPRGTLRPRDSQYTERCGNAEPV
jgi:hypothetical protein